MIVVVSDTSPIRALHHLDLLRLMNKLYERIIIPHAVMLELEQPAKDFKPVPASQIPYFEIAHVRDPDQVRRLRERLDEGEAEAISLALEMHADFLLIDDRAGRVVAGEVGLRYIGVIGILLRAKEAKLIDSVCPLIDRLRTELNFFISSALYDQVRNLAHE